MPEESPLEAALARELAQRPLVPREASGFTQEQVVERAQINRNYYQLLENGLSDRAKGTPASRRFSTLDDLVAALDCSVGDPVEGTGSSR